MKTLQILMSTYNGAKYIREQMDSLLDQNCEKLGKAAFRIVIRDDGSSDGTQDILEEYAGRYPEKVSWYQGENHGVIRSFFELLQRVDASDYYAFCDQDDIWFPEKISLAVKWLDAQNQNQPLLYYSLSEMFDENGVLGLQEPPKNSLCFRRAMTGTFGVGFSMVVNKRLRDEMLKCDPDKVHSHDWLAGAIALGFGKIYVESKICARYRRLETSVTKISFTNRRELPCRSAIIKSTAVS